MQQVCGNTVTELGIEQISSGDALASLHKTQPFTPRVKQLIFRVSKAADMIRKYVCFR